MAFDFAYGIIGDAIEIEQYTGDESIVSIPETIEGKKVTSIKKYAFKECRGIVEVVLADSIESIGSHAFYNCRRLEKITLSDRAADIGDGAFKNCDELRAVCMNREIKKSGCIKGILEEINHEIVFDFLYRDEENGEKNARILFPKYMYQYNENTSAKVVCQETLGSGMHYRECMNPDDVDYKRYDDNFRVAMALESEKTAQEIAINRLMYPYQLSKEADEKYRQYIEKNLIAILNRFISEEDMERIEFLGTLNMFREDNIDELLEIAYRSEKPAVTGYFMDYKHKNFRREEKRFEF